MVASAFPTRTHSDHIHAPGGDATYDAWGRMVKLDDSAGTIAEYVYDGLGRRVQKVDKTGASDVTYDYYYTGWQTVEVHKDGDEYEQFIYHMHYIDAPAVRFYDTGSGYVLQQYLYDAQFNVIALLDTSGTVIERYRYTPYGEQIIMDASFDDDYDSDGDPTDNVSVYANNKGYTGQTLDPESGLWYFRARMYHAQLGRFVSFDPAGFVNGMNAHAGIFGMLGGVDPSGRLTVNFTRTPGYINKRLRGAAGQAIASVSVTASCERCANDDDPERCWMLTDLTVSIVGTIYIDEEDFADGRRPNGQTLPRVYGHEQEHIDRYEEAFEEISEDIEDRVGPSQLARLEGDCRFKTKRLCERYVERQGGRMEQALSSRRDIREAFRIAGLHEDDDGAPEDAPGEDEGFEPDGDVEKTGDHPDETHPGEEINDLR